MLTIIIKDFLNWSLFNEFTKLTNTLYFLHKNIVINMQTEM